MAPQPSQTSTTLSFLRVRPFSPEVGSHCAALGSLTHRPSLPLLLPPELWFGFPRYCSVSPSKAAPEITSGLEEWSASLQPTVWGLTVGSVAARSTGGSRVLYLRGLPLQASHLNSSVLAAVSSVFSTNPQNHICLRYFNP